LEILGGLVMSIALQVFRIRWTFVSGIGKEFLAFEWCFLGHDRFSLLRHSLKFLKHIKRSKQNLFSDTESGNLLALTVAS